MPTQGRVSWFDRVCFGAVMKERVQKVNVGNKWKNDTNFRIQIKVLY